MALRAQRTRHRASRCDTVMSLPTRLSVSSTIMRIRRRRRRSKIGERTSIVESIAYLPMLSYRAQTATPHCAFLVLRAGCRLSAVGCRECLTRENNRPRNPTFAAAQLTKPKAAHAVGRADLGVVAVAFGPDLVGHGVIDSIGLGLVELDRGAADGADAHVIQRAARGNADEWDCLRQTFAEKIRADLLRDFAAF